MKHMIKLKKNAALNFYKMTIRLHFETENLIMKTSCNKKINCLHKTNHNKQEMYKINKRLGCFLILGEILNENGLIFGILFQGKVGQHSKMHLFCGLFLLLSK